MAKILSLITILAFLISACSAVAPRPTSSTPDAPKDTPTPEPTQVPETKVTFRLHLPSPLSGGETISLNILDEVTGLALNATSYTLTADDPETYFVALPLTIGSAVKYRYTRQGNALAQEHAPDGRPVRYRLLHVEGPAVVDDTLSRWNDTDFSGPTGRITGQVTEANSGQPLANILVSAGGIQTLSASDGTYLLDGLPPGTHTLVFYALDGRYRTFQQGAVVAAESATPATVSMTPTSMVRVVFVAHVPKGTLPAVPLRIAGNLWQLGNTFSDLAGGISTLAARMPVLSPLPDGSYSLALDLPAGADIRYKYTLGDGFWNAEHLSDGSFNLRQLLVPETGGLVINDTIESWMNGESAPVTFDLQAPANTPAGEMVSIQFNPAFGWMQPMPMWPVGNGRWIYVLYSPLDGLEGLRYRYCRNDQCGSADDVKSAGYEAAGQPVKIGKEPVTINEPVTAWTYLEANIDTTTLPNLQIKPRPTGFVAGVEFQPGYPPSWGPYIPAALQEIRALNANMLFFTPTWTFIRANMPDLEPVAGRDPLWPDLTATLEQAAALGVKTAVFPTPQFPGGAGAWWEQGQRDFAWWNAWFERYRTFLLNHADLATRQNASALVLGGDWLAPALPDGKLADGSPSGVPADAAARWQSLIQDVRSRYAGTIIWAMPYSPGMSTVPDYLTGVDQFYIELSPSLQSSPDSTEDQMATEASRILDAEIRPFQLRVGKPVLLGLSYPSAKGGASGCVTAEDGSCIPFDALARPNPDIPSVQTDMQAQVHAYNAFLIAINERDWVSGIVSRGFYPPATLQDKSTSIHGKPAQGVLWYWYPRLLGMITP